MKQKELYRIMMTGITTGILLSHQSLPADTSKSAPSLDQKEGVSSSFLELVASTKGNITYRPLTEDDLFLELNEETAELYKSLSPEGQRLALKLASRSCNGMNDCKGENACATDKNKCVGLGQCKGQTKCAFSDKNLAIKVAAKKMGEKRRELQKPST